MSNTTTILLSHDKEDEQTAFALKDFLEDAFPSELIFISGRDLIGGQTWFQQIKDRLKEAKIIISLITTKSLESKWVYFESGAGFTEDKTIPLLTDNIKPEDLKAPLSLLHARQLNEYGIELLIKDIVKKVNLPREPKHLPDTRKLLNKIEKFLRKQVTQELESMISIKEIAPNAIKQWIYLENCLVQDFIIQGHQIAIDTYFYLDKTEIQLFDRSGSMDFINKMGQKSNFFPKPFNKYEIKGQRLIFETFPANEKLETIYKSLSYLLKQVNDLLKH